MKKNNNLIKITNTLNNEIRYFTKDSYVMKYIGCSQGALALVRSNNSRAYKGYVYEIVEENEKYISLLKELTPKLNDKIEDTKI